MLENNQDAIIKPMYLADKADPETRKLVKRIRRFSFESKVHMIQEKSFSLEPDDEYLDFIHEINRFAPEKII